MLPVTLVKVTGTGNVVPVFLENIMLPTLSSLLNYKNEKVIKNFIRNYNVSKNTADELFNDMLKYLWICKKHSLEQKTAPDQDLHFQFVMHEEMRDIDNMWHTFILYTKEYTQFCLDYFGEYMHHAPDVGESIRQTKEEFSSELEKYLSYVYDHLGEKTVRSWFGIHV